MAESYNETDPPIMHDYVPPRGKGMKVAKDEQTPIIRRVPGIIYDERSTYRHDYADIPPPYHQELPWRSSAMPLKGRTVRGTLPGFYGSEYIDPYSKLEGGSQPFYESSGAERMRQDIADEHARQKEVDKAIPVPRMTMPELPIEKFSEYRSGYCKTVTSDDETLPDVKPMANGLYKYYQGEDNFSYNSQHSNKNY